MPVVIAATVDCRAATLLAPPSGVTAENRESGSAKWVMKSSAITGLGGLDLQFECDPDWAATGIAGFPDAGYGGGFANGYLVTSMARRSSLCGAATVESTVAFPDRHYFS
jgi:hypothetical protein